MHRTRTPARAGLVALAGLVLSAVLARPVRAQGLSEPPDTGQPAPERPLDYDTASEHWNGLHTLTAVARGMGLEVEAAEELEWDELGAGDILFVLYPRERLEPGHLAAFIRNGGHILLADDFGDSTEALGRLGMLREPATGVSAQRFYRDLPFAPMARPVNPTHPLAAGVTEVATNHPAVLVQVRGAEVVFGFGPGQGVVAAGALGSGRFVVSSDPSMFINRMLQFEGNLQLAINTLRFLSRGGAARRLLILTGAFRVYGEPEGLLDDGTVRGTVGSLLGDVNRWLEERNDYLLTHVGMRAAAVLIAALVALIALLSLPLARPGRLDGRWTRAASGSARPDDPDTLVRRYEHAGRGDNFLLPAAMLRDAVNRCLARILDESDPLYTRGEHELARMLVEARGQAAATALRRVYKRLKSLPSRTQAASLWSTGHMPRRDFERLHEDAVELYLALGEEPG